MACRLPASEVMRGTKPDEQLERPHQGRLSLAMLRREAASCTACDLYKRATQTVFGEGSASARLVLVGEQPGHEEDLAGRPFVGPAGRLLDEALEACRPWFDKELWVIK